MSPHKRKLMALCVDAVKRGGLFSTSVKIAQQTGISCSAVAKVLSQANAEGLLKTRRFKCGAVWFTPEREAEALAHMAREREEMNRRRITRQYQRLKGMVESAAVGQVVRLPPAMLKVLAELDDCSPTTAEIADRAGLSRSSVKVLMSQASRAGLAHNVAPPGVAARWRPGRLHVQGEQPSPDDPDPIVQRIGVDPRLPLPFKCRAAASVFHLGAGL